MLITKLIVLMLIKKINNTNDDFIENIRDLFNNKLDKKKLIIIILMMIL